MEKDIFKIRTGDEDFKEEKKGNLRLYMKRKIVLR